jgi:Flp pilus assembly protein TadG
MTAPVAFLIFFTALEFGRVNMIRHSMENATYEGARRGLVPGTSEAEIRQATKSVLDAVSVINPRIRISNRTDDITVSVEADFNEQGWFAPIFFYNKTLATTLTLTKDETG